MKNKLIVLAVLLSSPVILWAQENKLTKYIPSNASLVMVFNPMQIANKVPGETFRQSALYRSIMKGDKGGVGAFLSDPSICGIDLNSNLYIVSVPGEKGNTISIMGTLKDEEAFSKIVNKMPGVGDDIKSEDNAKIYVSKDGSAGMAWNKETFIMVGPNKTEMKKELIKVFSDTARKGEFDYEKWMQDYTDKYVKQLYQTCSILIHPEKQASSFANATFNNMMNESGDIRYWSNGSLFSGPMPDAPPGFANLLSSLKTMTGSNKTSIINFENGKIVGVNRNYLNEEIADAYKKFPPRQINGSLLRKLPPGKLIGVFTSSVQPELGNMLMNKSGMAGFLDSLKAKAPFDISLFKSTFGGDMLVAVLDKGEANMKKDDDSPEKIYSRFEIVGAVSILDKSRFEKLNASIGHVIDSMKETEAGQKMFKGFRPIIRYNDSLLVMASSKELAENFITSPGDRPVPDWVSAYQGHPMLMELDMKEFFGTLVSTAARLSPNKNEEMPKFFDMFDKMLIYGGDYADGSLTSRVEFSFAKKDENSFKQLFDLLDYSLEQSEKRKVELKDEEVELPPPPPPIQERKKDVKKTTTPVKPKSKTNT